MECWSSSTATVSSSSVTVRRFFRFTSRLEGRSVRGGGGGEELDHGHVLKWVTWPVGGDTTAVYRERSSSVGVAGGCEVSSRSASRTPPHSSLGSTMYRRAVGEFGKSTEEAMR
ncbi:hypothetical protein E2C01_027864 [Portunus trituberculatus]|uniref:Uncharacterized protein n=1 Tax=Portunus trituberculatus TaxID=210409 RepID=A0A5B7ENC6_PORTR|nr:hypothetical protein [Portunus trituberculatus]